VAEQVERELGTETLRNMHCHFSKIEFGDKGEKRHRVLDDAGYGPEFDQLAEVVDEFKLRPVVICETLVQDVDAAKMRKILRGVAEKNSFSQKT
jgi:deoxyribonuclease IV